jgi:hypothetical protein
MRPLAAALLAADSKPKADFAAPKPTFAGR